MDSKGDKRTAYRTIDQKAGKLGRTRYSWHLDWIQAQLKRSLFFCDKLFAFMCFENVLFF
jgi:hypothetical protein